MEHKMRGQLSFENIMLNKISKIIAITINSNLRHPPKCSLLEILIILQLVLLLFFSILRKPINPSFLKYSELQMIHFWGMSHRSLLKAL